MKRLCKSDIAHEYDKNFCQLLGLTDMPDPLEDFDGCVAYMLGDVPGIDECLMERLEALDAANQRLKALKAVFIKAEEKLREAEKKEMK